MQGQTTQQLVVLGHCEDAATGNNPVSISDVDDGRCIEQRWMVTSFTLDGKTGFSVECEHSGTTTSVLQHLEGVGCTSTNQGKVSERFSVP